MRTDSKYSISLDVLRVIAGIAVVLIHITSPVVAYPPFYENPVYWLANALDSISRVAVPLFIMMSGYFLLDPDKHDTFKEFMKKRMVRVGIPLIAWSLLYVGWKVFFHHEQFIVDRIIPTLIRSRSYYHLYFLYVIMGLYVITPILRWFILNSSKANIRVFLTFSFIAVMIPTFVKGFKTPGLDLFSTAFTFFIPYIPYFVAGAYFRTAVLKKWQYIMFLGLFLMLFVFTVFANHWYMNFVGWSRHVSFNPAMYLYFLEYFSPNVIFMSLLIFVVFVNNKYLRNIRNEKYIQSIKLLSTLVFGVYVIHPMVIDVLDRYTFFDLSRVPSPVGVFMVFKFIAVTVISFVLIFFLRKASVFKYITG